MRVLHVIPSLAPCHGGPSTVLPLMEKALAGAGVEVETATTDDAGPGKRYRDAEELPRSEAGVPRHFFPKQTEFYKVSLPLRRWLRREVGSYDLVHIHALFSHASVAAAAAARRAGVPYIIRPLGVLNRYGMERRRALLKRVSFRWIESPLIRDAAALHFTSEAEREEAESLKTPFHAAVIPLGVGEPRVRAEAGPSDSPNPSVLYLSRLDPKKNVESLLRAWRTVSLRHPDWKLIIAGSGDPDHVTRLRALADELALGSSLEWRGQVAGTEKESLLDSAAIFVLPSFSENFGIAAAEALLAGKACLFTPGVAVGNRAAKAGGALLSQPDPQSLARHLLQLIEGEDLRKTLAEAALKFGREELSLATMGHRLIHLYESLLSNAVTRTSNH